MDNNPMPLKSSVFGGFKKKDVLSYIFELNESTQDAQQKFAEQIEEMSTSRDMLAKDNAEMEMQIKELRAKLDGITTALAEEQQKNAEASELIERLKADAAKREQDIADKANDLIRQAALNTELSEKNRRLEEKREQVELAASQIASFLNSAQTDADRITQQAQAESDQITADAQSRADAIVNDAKASAKQHIDAANLELNGIYAKFSEFCNTIESFKKTALDASSDISAKLDAMSVESSKIRESVPQIPEPAGHTVLDYVEETLTPMAQPAAPAPVSDEPSSFTKDILRRYGVRKDDSGFFRLAADK